MTANEELIARIEAADALIYSGKGVGAAVAIQLHTDIKKALVGLPDSAADAWDEGAESAFYDPEIRDLVNYPDNPYRAAAPEGDGGNE